MPDPLNSRLNKLIAERCTVLPYVQGEETYHYAKGCAVKQGRQDLVDDAIDRLSSDMASFLPPVVAFMRWPEFNVDNDPVTLNCLVTLSARWSGGAVDIDGPPEGILPVTQPI